MKTAFVLVGLVTGAATATAAPRLARSESPAPAPSPSPSPSDNFDAWLDVTYDAPARTEPRVATPRNRMAETARQALDTASSLTRLLATSTEVFASAPITRPLVDKRGNYACGNMPTKSGSKRVCRDRSGLDVSDFAALDD